MGQYLALSFSLLKSLVRVFTTPEPAHAKLGIAILALFLCWPHTAVCSAATLSRVSCGSSSFTGAGTNLCSVYLSSAATANVNVALYSNNAAVSVPSVVSVAAGKSTAGFQATVSPVTKGVTAVVTAKAGTVSATFSMQLNPVVASLGVSSSAVNFGSIDVNKVATQALTLASKGAAPLIISGATTSGSGYSVSGANFPITLNPGQTSTLNLQFAPRVTGSATGQLTITSNDSASPITAVSLSGAGKATTALSSLSCTNSSMTAAGTNVCTVVLTTPAPAGGLSVSLSSSLSLVTVPSSILVQPNATQATFAASVSSFTSAQTATLTAAACNGSQTFAIQLVVSNSSFIFVDAAKGTDSAAGTQASPLKTIQAAVSKANTRNTRALASTIIVNPGVYREKVSISAISGQTNSPLTIQAANPGTAIIAGSDVLSNWAPESSNSSIFSSPWQYKFGTSAIPSGWPANIEPIVRRTEMIFVNSQPLTQVMATSQLQPGTFYVDETNSRLLAYPPAGATMQTSLVEAAVRSTTFNISGRSNITVRGLVFRHANSCVNHSSANITSSSNILVDQVQVLWNNWGGLGIYSSNTVTVQNSIASYNGGVGFVTNRDQNTLYSFNETDYNNWRGAQGAFYDWAMGGTKLFAMHGAKVQNHFSYNNQAQGLWFDTDNKDIVIDNATLVGSVNAALQIERNEGPITLQNSHLCSSGTGVNLLTSERVTIKDSSFYNNGGTNKYQAQIYLAGQAGGINISDWQTGQLYNLVTSGLVMSGNSFQDATAGQLLFGTYLSGSDWTTFASSLSSSNNRWYDPSTPASFKIVNGKIVNLASWQNAVGTDYSSIWAASSASVASSCSAPSPTYSDFHVNVDNHSYTMSSGQTLVTVRVHSYGAGAVALNMTGLPKGVTASINPSTLVSGTAKITISTSATAAAQTIPVTLWAATGGRVHSVTFQVSVAP